MKKILARIFHGMLLIMISAGFFVGSFFYETNFTNSVVLQRQNLVTMDSVSGQKTEVNRLGNKLSAGPGELLQAGDIVYSGAANDSLVRFSGDGVLRMADNTRILIGLVDVDKSAYSFKILDGKVWLNNLYSNANVDVVVDGGVIVPGQSVSLYQVADGKADIYSNQSNLLVDLVATDFSANKMLDGSANQIVNSLFLPRGTQATVYKSKLADNKDTVAKLLFSKLIKEFNYGVFDKALLSSDSWLSKNIEQDLVLTAEIRDHRLKNIRTRGLKYSNYESANYKLDESIRNVSNGLTFSEEKIGDRNLGALYDDLYDAQYLYDYGRVDEAKQRLDQFSSTANQLFLIYGDRLKAQYTARVKKEYEYLSFVNPGDSLYQLRRVLEKLYLDSIKGSPEELSVEFDFLIERMNAVGYFADAKDFKNLKSEFDAYMTQFKALLKKYDKQLTSRIVFIQQQNQSLDNLFMQYPDFYRVGFITDKLYVENQYLNLLPAIKDKPEEIQTVIAQRIDFLRKLQMYFLDGDVPLIDAQNIVALLFSEISKIELPAEYQVAVAGLFNERLQDYGVFERFLNSPEYVGSKVRGVTMKDRFAAFKKDNTENVSIDALRSELGTGSASIGNNQYQLGKIVSPTVENIKKVVSPAINEETVIKQIDGQSSILQNQIDTTVSTSIPAVNDANSVTANQNNAIKPKVPRVKRPNL